ncbi:MAG: DUF6279 family lipoprotein [Pseudomonadota bacterium]
MKKFNTQDSLVRRFRTLCLIALMLAVAACSSVRFAYNQGDTLLYWWVNAYLDLDSEQAGQLKEDIGQLFSWHRKTQLKEYSQFLVTAQRQLASGNVTQADLKADYRDIRARTELLASKAVPDLADLALSIKPEQIAKMEEKFSKNNETFRKKFIRIDHEKKQKLRYKKSMEQLDLWFGGFSSEQEAQLRRASDARVLDNELWLSERIVRQKRILAVLREVQQKKLGKDATVVLMQNLVNDIFGRFDAPEHKAFYDAYTDGTINLVLTAIKIATPVQKAHAQKRMQGWIDDFKALSSDPK